MILRSVRSASEGSPEFVAPVAVTVAGVLTLTCLLLQVYCLHQSSLMLQASTILRRIYGERFEQVERLYPDRIDRGDRDGKDRSPAPSDGPCVVVRAEHSAFLRRIDEAQPRSVARRPPTR